MASEALGLLPIEEHEEHEVKAERIRCLGHPAATLSPLWGRYAMGLRNSYGIDLALAFFVYFVFFVVQSLLL
jgi:hypothetical protein